MEKDKIIILVEKENLNPEKLRSMIDVDGCGSVVSFVGLTRGEDNAIKVKRLEFDAWENKLFSSNSAFEFADQSTFECIGKLSLRAIA